MNLLRDTEFEDQSIADLAHSNGFKCLLSRLGDLSVTIIEEMDRAKSPDEVVVATAKFLAFRKVFELVSNLPAECRARVQGSNEEI